MKQERCGECGGLLATREERQEQRCERCIFARDWELMELRRDWETMRPLLYQPGVRQAMWERAQAQEGAHVK